MLDIKRIRNNPEEIIEALKKRRGEYPIQKLLDTDEKSRINEGGTKQAF